MEHKSTAIFSSILCMVIMILTIPVGVRYHNVVIENEILTQRVDSLKVECQKKDVSIDDATSIALSLSERIGKLYEIDPVTHKKLFNEAD